MNQAPAIPSEGMVAALVALSGNDFDFLLPHVPLANILVTEVKDGRVFAWSGESPWMLCAEECLSMALTDSPWVLRIAAHDLKTARVLLQKVGMKE